MTQKTSAEKPASKTARNKTDKADIGNIMDDAPLFAGLDDYVQKHIVRLKTEPAEVGEKKKKGAAGKTKLEALSQTATQSIPKAQMAPSAEIGAVLLSVTELCAMLKISRATLVRMDKSG